MSASNTLETEFLQHLFQNANIALIGDATGLRGSTVAGVFYISLHTADPGEAGNQSSNEATYTGYARISVARTGGAWTVSGNLVENAALLTFAECTAGANTITHFGIGTDASGTGKLLISGPLSANLAVSAGIIPEFAAGALDVTLD